MNITRQSLLAKVHIAKKALGMDDDAYRDFLQTHTGKRSAADLDMVALDRLLYQMKRIGFVPTTAKTKNKGKRPTAPRAKMGRARILAKITAQLTTRELHWNYAHAMARRMFGKEQVQWLDDEQLYKLMQALQVDQNRRARKSEAQHE